MVRELGKLQPQSSSRRIINNQSSSNSSRSSSSTIGEEMRAALQLPAGERWMAALLTAVAALSYVTAGTMVGWSSGAFRHRAASPAPLADNWSISLAATPALVLAVTAVGVHRCYRWIGTKAFLLTGALLAVASAALEALHPSFWCISAARVLAGIAAGIAFTLLPSYVGECGLAPKRLQLLDDLTATAFPVGVLLRFAADWLLPPPGPSSWAGLCWAAPPACSFLCLLLLPESARYLCATGRVRQAAAVLQRADGGDDADGCGEQQQQHQQHHHEPLLAAWQQPGPGLLEAVRAHGSLTQLVPLLSLFAFQAFVGALPLLFYLATLLELAGHERAPARAATLLAVVLAGTVPLARKLLRHRPHHRTLLVASALTIAGTTFALGWHCHARRIRPAVPGAPPDDWQLPAFALLFAAYAVGFQRVPGALLKAAAHPEHLFALRALAVSVCWGSVYLAVRLLPVLLRTIGLGWVLWNAGLVALFAALVVLLGVPPDSGDFEHKSLPKGSRDTGSSSASSSASPSTSSPPGTPGELPAKEGNGHSAPLHPLPAGLV